MEKKVEFKGIEFVLENCGENLEIITEVDGQPSGCFVKPDGEIFGHYGFFDGGFEDPEVEAFAQGVFQNEIAEFVKEHDEKLAKMNKEYIRIFLSADAVKCICSLDCDLGDACDDEDFELRKKVREQLAMRGSDNKFGLTEDVAEFVFNALDWYCSNYFNEVSNG